MTVRIMVVAVDVEVMGIVVLVHQEVITIMPNAISSEMTGDYFRR